MSYNKEKLAYWAGIIDGEGSIQLYKRVTKKRGYTEYYLRVRIGMTLSNPILEEICNIWGGSLYRFYPKGGKKEMLNWQVWGNGAKVFLIEILPYLILKKKKAENAIKFREHMEGVHKSTRVSKKDWEIREKFHQKSKLLQENPY